MAGGMGRGGVPLHARARLEPETRPARPTERATQRPAETPDECPVKHCWVDDPVDQGPPRHGLLLEWRRDEADRWQGRVSYAAQLRPGRWATVEEWLGAERLTPL